MLCSTCVTCNQTSDNIVYIVTHNARLIINSILTAITNDYTYENSLIMQITYSQNKEDNCKWGEIHEHFLYINKSKWNDQNFGGN